MILSSLPAFRFLGLFHCFFSGVFYGSESVSRDVIYGFNLMFFSAGFLFSVIFFGFCFCRLLNEVSAA